MSIVYCKDKRCFSINRINDDELQGSKKLFNYFDVDELLAYPIKLLNEKGYETVMSCAGHYDLDATIRYVNEESKTDFDDKIFIDCVRKGSECIVFSYNENDDIEDTMFISFSRDIEIKTVPNGWYYDKDNNSINSMVQKNNGYGNYLTEKALKINNLLNWIDQLETKYF